MDLAQNLETTHIAFYRDRFSSHVIMTVEFDISNAAVLRMALCKIAEIKETLLYSINYYDILLDNMVGLA